MTWPEVIKRTHTTCVISKDDLDRFESKLGYRLPQQYRNFLLTYNGGRITMEHDIPLEEFNCSIELAYLHGLSEISPGIGVDECRARQESEMLGIRQALEIGTDMGPGAFYLLLAGNQVGAVYFAFREDVWPVTQEDWDSTEVVIPDCMAFVCSSFDELKDLIEKYPADPD